LTKVDRTGAYKAREIAKNILIDNNQLSWCEVQIAYAIGIEEPLSINIETDLGEIEPKKALYNDCKPKNIIKDLGLKNICYEDKAKFGHFID
jgi:S-adenosylmethionine synthetase